MTLEQQAMLYIRELVARKTSLCRHKKKEPSPLEELFPLCDNLTKTKSQGPHWIEIQARREALLFLQLTKKYPATKNVFLVFQFKPFHF
jgi:hypothetical protein